MAQQSGTECSEANINERLPPQPFSSYLEYAFPLGLEADYRGMDAISQMKYLISNFKGLGLQKSEIKYRVLETWYFKQCRKQYHMEEEEEV